MSMLLTSDQVLLQAASYPAAKKPRLGLDLNVDISSDPNATLLKTTSTAQISNQGKNHLLLIAQSLIYCL